MNPEEPILVMIQGAKPGERWELETTRVTSVGRSSRNTVHLLSPTVSRFHCEIAFSNGLWYISDLNSRKGTYLNGREVGDREVLKPGDVIRISGNLLRFTEKEELDEANADIEEVGEEGIDLLQENTVKEALQKDASIDWSKKAGGMVLRGKNALKGMIVPALAVALCFGSSAAILGYADTRLEERREAIRRNEIQAEHDLQSVKQSLDQSDDIHYPSVLSELARIAREYSAYPEAEEAAEKYRTIERSYFQQGMQQVYDYLLEEDYDEAVEKLSTMAGIVKADDLRRRIRTEVRFLSQDGIAAAERFEERTPEPEARPDTSDREAAILRRAREQEDWDDSTEIPDEEELHDRLERPPLF